MARMKKAYWHNAIWYALGAFTGGYVMGFAKRALGKA